jgi:hypothetical protein
MRAEPEGLNPSAFDDDRSVDRPGRRYGQPVCGSPGVMRSAFR